PKPVAVSEPEPAKPQAAPAAPPAPPAPPSVPETAPAGEAEPAGPLSPLVRKMARENNIDLAQIKGTGAGGRITKQDVEAYIASAKAPVAVAPPPPAPAPAAPPAQPAAPPPPPPPCAPPPPRRPRAAAGRTARIRAAVARRTGPNPHRTAQHDASEDRRAHGHVQAHLAARDHRPPRRYDQGGEDARAPQGA